MELLSEAEAQGITLRIVGGKVKASLPGAAKPMLEPMLERLRAHRDEILSALRQRSSLPPLPQSVRLVSWNPKEPPIALERCSIVTDVHLFISSTLEQLDAALKGNTWLAGNWSVRELLDRLEQVGVVLAVEAKWKRSPDSDCATARPSGKGRSHGCR